MQRLELLNEQIGQKVGYVQSSFDFLNASSFLTKEENVEHRLI